jgi:thiol peroxidase
VLVLYKLFSAFYGAEGIENVEAGSTFRSHAFGRDYGLEILTGRLKGLLARAIVVINESGKIMCTQPVHGKAQ